MAVIGVTSISTTDLPTALSAGQGIAYVPGATTADDRLWTANNADDKIHLLRLTNKTSSGTYNLQTANSFPRGVSYTVFAADVWIVDNGGSVYFYNPTTGAAQTDPSATLESGNSTPRGVCHVTPINENWILDDGSTKRVYRYHSEGQYLSYYDFNRYCRKRRGHHIR